MMKKVEVVEVDSTFSGSAIKNLLENCRSDYLLLSLQGGRVEFGARALERLVQVADDSGAGMIYCDFREKMKTELSGTR